MRSEAGFREHLYEVMAAQPGGRVLGRKLQACSHSRTAAAVASVLAPLHALDPLPPPLLPGPALPPPAARPQGDALREWCGRLTLTCYSPYGAEIAFPQYFADLTMWVSKVVARPPRPAGAAAKAPRAKAAGARVPAPQCIPHHQLRGIDLEASVSPDFLAARKKERSRRGEKKAHQPRLD